MSQMETCYRGDDAHRQEPKPVRYIHYCPQRSESIGQVKVWNKLVHYFRQPDLLLQESANRLTYGLTMSIALI